MFLEPPPPPPYMADVLPAKVPVEHIGEFIERNHLRVVRRYWTARGELVIEVTDLGIAHAALSQEEATDATH